ncbi:hypothetical protein [Aneurinibacillus tyrosinisolvens]|uniref:hypothetical protein n=1 Tax=Aneurinibacillus tyrosinisolvens TaxID=1443435 RepID=UPI00063F46C2|nr:hypothetical protein [Aneurinibacillus tyrosinisolvens]
MAFKKKFISSLFVLLLLVTLMPFSAFAYTYGNPNEEAVAENYKQVMAKLNQNPPDFAGALQLFKPIQKELDMHMGPKPSQVIEKALNDKNKETAVYAYQQTLVLNMARRLESIEKDFANYQQNKLLLAKALATYDALSPVIKGKDAALDQKIRADFNKALESLGNPGLFGVGVKKPDQNTFTAQKNDILKSLQTHFNMKSLEVGHFMAGEGPGNPANNGTSAGMGGLKNWIPIAVIVLVLGFIVYRTMRRRRG